MSFAQWAASSPLCSKDMYLAAHPFLLFHISEQQQQQQQQQLFNNKNILFQMNKYFNILTGPRIASASLGGPVHQDLINHFFVNK